LKKLIGLALVVIIAIGAVYATALARFDADVIRASVESALNGATAREWHVDGPVEFKPGVVPAVEVHDIRAANVPWASEDDIAILGKARFESGWVDLITGSRRITAVRIEDVVINLETNGDGGPNWMRPNAVTERAAGPLPLSNLPVTLMVERTVIRFRSGWAEAERHYPIDRVVLEARGAAVPLGVSVDARVNGQPLSIGGDLGSPAAMFDNQPFDVVLSGTYSGKESNAEINVDGRIGRLERLEGLDLRFTLKADSLNEVGSISGFELPRDTPVKITALLENAGDGVQLRDYVLRIGQAIIRPQD